ncbi:MAG TPA: quinone oxidoreductase [Burkholderiales bacterium]|jgi:NADPH2:quinone reductase|nr:quinone oxidoreductase [Burkholderiales bacterium]
MAKAIRFHKTGGPEVLQLDDIEVGDPGEGQAKIRHTAIGLNFIDTYHRSGLYPLPLPSGVGSEGAGVVEAIGKGVTQVKVGDRVAYAGGPPGAYSEQRLYAADRLVKVPKGISDEQAAAMMLKGLTVQYLIRRVYRVQKGETVLFHAAAGGVGLIACQWLKALGATVIGTVGSDAKANVAREHGCDHTIVYTRENFAERVKEITGGRKVPVVFDSVGKDTFTGSLDCLQPRGLLAVFGNGSGPVTGVDINTLARGSFYVTRPTLMTYTAMREDLEWMSKELFDVVKSGKVKIEINQSYKLADAAQAHRDLEARKTTGSTVLLP